MELVLSKHKVKLQSEEISVSSIDIQYVSNLKAGVLNILIFIKIFILALGKYRSLAKTYKALLRLEMIRRIYYDGRHPDKFRKIGNRYYYNMYVPGFPSAMANKLFRFELEKAVPANNFAADLRVAFLAITRKCPLKCEHCFEWENLNKKETFTLENLEKTVEKLILSGVVQIFLSGGEPMLRVKEIERLCKLYSGKVDFWVVTSGFNATYPNLSLLKSAGLAGISLSIDHYDKNLHNLFRGSEDSYDNAVNAVRFARSLNLPVTMNVCVTKVFAEEIHLLRYAELAKSLDATFIQFLEPKAVGKYASKNVLLEDTHKNIIREFTVKINSDSQYHLYPLALYHGYYQRKIGCFAAGNRSLYIDSSGDVLSCPFCHNKAGNILKDDFASLLNTIKGIGCTDYKVAEI